MEVDQVKHEVAIANRMLDEAGLATGLTAAFGHASMRIPSEPDRFVVKGRGYPIDALARMQPEDMIVCDLEGNLIDGPPGVMQCYEVKIHSCLYAAHPEIGSVVHVHPQYSILASVLQLDLVPMGGAGSPLFEQPVPIYHHTGLVATEAQGTEMVQVMGSSPVVLLEGHGAVSSGTALEDSVITMWQLENQAKMNWLAYCAVGPNHRRLPQELIDENRRQPPFWQSDHFKSSWVENSTPVTATGLIWAHYADLIDKRM